jgi:hypothetical protein
MQISKKSIFGGLIAILAIVFVACLGRIGEDVKNEQIVVNQFPFSGEMEYWTTPGFKWQWFGKTTHYFKTSQLWFGAEDENKQQLGNPIPVIFNDASEGMIYGSLRVKLPTDPTYLARIQTDYNGMDRLMNDLVRPTVTKVIYSSGPLMSAFESYAEKKNDLIEYITDQLNNGVYKTTVKTVETIDPISGEKKTVKVATLVVDETAPGGYARSEKSPFQYYGISIGANEGGQVSISKIDYSQKVKDQIAQQQEANMMVQTSKAKTLAAQQEAIRAEEAGKAAATEAKWQQEKIKAVEVTKAEQAYEVARLQALEAKEIAKKIEQEGVAKAAANRALVNAGLTPLEKATIEKETKIGVAQALAKIQLPTYVVAGGNGGNGSTAMDAMGLKMMTDLVNQMSK